jgi:hypothetical protein
MTTPLKLVNLGNHSEPANHTRRAIEMILDWLQLRAAVQKQKAQKISLQLGASLVFGSFLLIWAELAAYFALRTVMAPHWAAFLVFLLNGMVVTGVNLVVMRWKAQALDAQEVNYKKDEATQELLTAKNELVALKNEFVENTSAFVNEKIVVPYERYKMPMAFAATFFTGLVVAKALYPVPRPESLVRDEDDRDDLRVLI